MSKKYLLLFFIIIFSVLQANSQDKGDFRLGIYGSALTMYDHILPQYGLVGEYFLSHNFSMNYRYGMGYNADGEIMGHINPSIIGAAYAVTASAEELIWTFLIPEGFSYHAYPTDNFEIAPYLNPLGSEINFYNKPSLILSGSFGMNLHIKPSEDFSITPNAGAMFIYRDSQLFPYFGVSLNYNFDD